MYIITIDNGQLWSVDITLKMADQGRSDGTLCSFYQDPLRPELLCLVSYEFNIDMVASDRFSEPVYSVAKPYGVK